MAGSGNGNGVVQARGKPQERCSVYPVTGPTDVCGCYRKVCYVMSLILDLTFPVVQLFKSRSKNLIKLVHFIPHSKTVSLLNFMVTPCISNIQHYFPSNAHNVKKVELLKHFKISKTAPTCFGLQGNHHQGTTASTQLKLHTWFIVDTQSLYKTLSVLWLHIVTCEACVL